MSIDCKQLKEIIIEPTLMALGLKSPSAVNLLLGTCAQETNMGSYLVQKKIGMKGGIGIYQMQAPSYEMIWTKVVSKSPAMKSKLRLLLNYDGKPPAERLASDLKLATAMCRLYYYSIDEKLPDADDIPALAAYWKKWYNTRIGKGTEQQFVTNYSVFVSDKDA